MCDAAQGFCTGQAVQIGIQKLAQRRAVHPDVAQKLTLAGAVGWGVLRRLLYKWNNTLCGRMMIGPMISMSAFYK